MKKRLGNLIFLCAMAVIIGISVQLPEKGQEDLSVKEQESLPVLQSTAIYPEFDLPSLVDKAACIVEAEVVEVGDTMMEHIDVSFTENPDEATETLSYPVTPVTLQVKKSLKGGVQNDTIIYYEDGGKTSSYIQLPNGFYMEEGMELVLFLDKDGYCWGRQSMFPLANDKVILNEMAMNYMEHDDIATMETRKIRSVVKEQISDPTVQFMEKEKFSSVIEALVSE